MLHFSQGFHHSLRSPPAAFRQPLWCITRHTMKRRNISTTMCSPRKTPQTHFWDAGSLPLETRGVSWREPAVLPWSMGQSHRGTLGTMDPWSGSSTARTGAR